MHSMTNLAVVNISYLKFSSNAHGIMDSDRECAAAAIAIAVICKKRKRRIKKQCRQKRSEWVKDWLTKRNELGFERTLLREFRSENEDEYRRFLRMTAENFDELLDLIKIDIQGDDTTLREAIPASLKLAATIRFLATGCTYTQLQYPFRVHKSTLSKFIPEVCEALYNKLKDKHLKVRCLIH